MRTKFQRIGTILLALCMAFSLCVPAMAAGRATAQKCGSFIRGTFYFDPHEGSVEIGDLPDTYIYSDNYFQVPSDKTNTHLATMSMQLAAASISSCSYDRTEAAYRTRSRNVTDLLDALEFQDVAVNDYYNEKMGEDTMGVAVAHKKLDRHTVLLAIVPRSAGYEIEWSGNFNVGTEADGLHSGFKTARNIALDFAREYVATHRNAFVGKQVKVWTVGYSRGAGIANLIGANLAEGCNLGTKRIPVKVNPKNVYAYTFGTPNTVIPQGDVNPSGKRYAGIHNYAADYDPIKMIPCSAWGFTHYGQDTALPVDDATAKTKMLSFLQKINQNIYDIYANGEGEPDAFTAMKLDLSSRSVMPDSDNADLTQEKFLAQRIAYLTDHVVPTREDYVNENYQDMLRTVLVLKFGGDGNDLQRLVNQITAEDNRGQALTAGAALYLYALMQGCADQYGENETQNVSSLVALLAAAGINPEEQTAAASTEEKNETDEVNMAFAAVLNDFIAALPESSETNEPQVTAETDVEGQAEESEETEEPEENLSFSYAEGAAVSYQLAVTSVGNLLTTCVSGTEFTNLEKENLPNRLMDEEKFVEPLIRFATGAVFGVELSEEQKTERNILVLAQRQVNTAATLYCNAGKFMRVHNNEVILSWMRTMDSYYEERPTYALTAAATEHGTVKLSADCAREGKRITVTVTPDRGYKLSSLSVTAQNGKKVCVAMGWDGCYTFRMPAGDVVVNATFHAKNGKLLYGNFPYLTGRG